VGKGGGCRLTGKRNLEEMNVFKGKSREDKTARFSLRRHPTGTEDD